jgi:DNA (cytosine-5)-methyltransferase 1
MRFGSVCSGIEAASVAWHPLGWRAAWFSEIEPFPCAVLAHHYPEVPNHGDMTALPQLIRSGKVEAPDLFCGGTPCQAFSVAGLRRSLDDERGNLSLTFVEIADAIDDVRRARGDAECIVFWENVPGVLSTQDNAFGCFLGALAGCDTAIEPLAATGWTDAGVVAGPQRTVAWRVLDAQYFGLAQRRRRVFVVASAREGFDPAAVLLEWEGVRRDSAPSREAGKGFAHATAPCLTSSGRGVERTGDTRGQDPVVATIDASYGRLQGCSGQDANHGHSHLVAFGGNRTSGSIEVAPALLAQPGSGWKGDFESETFITQPIAFDTYNQTIGETAQTLCSRGDTPGGNAHLVPAVLAHAFDARQSDVLQYGDKTGPLDTDGHTIAVAQPIPIHDQATRFAGKRGDNYDGKGNGLGIGREGDPAPTLTKGDKHAVAQPVAFSAKDHGADATFDLSPTLRAMPHNESHANGGGQMAVAQSVANSFYANEGSHGSGQRVELCVPLKNSTLAAVQTAMQVRRLTPVECERLQGFPDDYTAIPWRNKPASECPDGPRYKALGNSWAVPVVRWIGRASRSGSRDTHAASRYTPPARSRAVSSPPTGAVSRHSTPSGLRWVGFFSAAMRHHSDHP